MTFPVVSADSDHRLLSGNPSGCAEVSQLYECPRKASPLGLALSLLRSSLDETRFHPINSSAVADRVHGRCADERVYECHWLAILGERRGRSQRTAWPARL